MAKLALLTPEVCTIGIFCTCTYTKFDSQALLVNLQLVGVQCNSSNVLNQIWNHIRGLIRSLICGPDELI